MPASNDDLLAPFRETEEPTAPSEPSVVRGVGPLTRLAVETCDGNVRAALYSSVLYTLFNPSVGITLVFPEHVWEFKGANLRPLFDGLLTQTVAKVKVLQPLFAGSPAGAVIVDKFTVRMQKPKDAIAHDS